MIAFLTKAGNQRRWFISKKDAREWGDLRTDPRSQTVVEGHVITTAKDIVNLLNEVETNHEPR